MSSFFLIADPVPSKASTISSASLLAKGDPFLSLAAAISQRRAKLISHVIAQHDSITPIEQDESQVSHCQKITKEDGRLDWSLETALQAHNKSRAYTPWPGVYTFWNELKLSLIDFVPHGSENSPHSPGTVFQDDHLLW